jgi:Sulfate permease family/CBS domain
MADPLIAPHASGHDLSAVTEDTPLDEIAELLERHRIKRVPVLRDGKLVGLVSRADVDGVIPLAFACLLLSYVESVSAARAIARANGYEINARQELLGLGAANLAASLFQGYPVAGGHFRNPPSMTRPARRRRSPSCSRR